MFIGGLNTNTTKETLQEYCAAWCATFHPRRPLLMPHAAWAPHACSLMTVAEHRCCTMPTNVFVHAFVRDALSRRGDMSDIVLMEGRGFGFVTFRDSEHANKFLEVCSRGPPPWREFFCGHWHGRNSLFHVVLGYATSVVGC